MATGKKSFVFYCNWRNTFVELPKDKGYDLLMHILAYVNDENPQTDDILIRAVFANIKDQLKADLKRWEVQHNQRIEAGKASAKSRQRKSTSVNERSISSTVSVSGSVSGSVSDSVNETKKEKGVALPFLDNEFKKAWQIWKDYKKDEHKFKYKSDHSEKHALAKLNNLADGDIDTALKIIHTSIANGWKGFFALEVEPTNGDEPSMAEQMMKEMKKYRKKQQHEQGN